MQLEPSEAVDASAGHAEGTADGATPTGEGTGGGDEPLDAQYAKVFDLMTERCVSCHGPGKSLDLSEAALAHEQLVGVAAKYKACAGDGGMPPVRVVMGAPSSSLLMAKLEGRQECGKPMPPPPAAMLSEGDLDTFRRWIGAGAKLH